MGLVAIGVTLLMICGEFDLSVGSVFALMPMTMAVLMTHGVPVLCRPSLLGPPRLRRDRLHQRLRDDRVRHTELHHHARHAVHGALADRGDLRRLPAAAACRHVPSWLFTAYVGPGGLFRMSFLWFVGIARAEPRLLLSRTNFGNWIKRDRRLPRRRRPSMGIPINAGEDHLLHALLDAGGLRRHDPGAAARTRRCRRSAMGWSCRRSPRR